MAFVQEIGERKTSADAVFDHLYRGIVALDILPGTKISEVEIAKQFGVSRQPVRDAFSKLGNQGLLIIRPQRATVVRHFSLDGIGHARFIRTAVEVEVLRHACRTWTGRLDPEIDDNLAAQRRVIDADDVTAFHGLDYEFHRLLCQSAQAEFAFETIADQKAQVDRLCVLSLTSQETMDALLEDHLDIVGGLRAGDQVSVEASIRRHLGRLTSTIESVYASHREYFED